MLTILKMPHFIIQICSVEMKTRKPFSSTDYPTSEKTSGLNKVKGKLRLLERVLKVNTMCKLLRPKST